MDDSTENLKLLVNLLENDYQLVIAKSGEQSLKIIQSDANIDLILLDIIMPKGINGYEVCEFVKSQPSTKDIPIIFLTGLNEANDETRGLQIGGADYITKPFHPEIVKARIRTQIELISEREKSTNLLEILLPKNVISELKEFGSYQPIMHENVSILFCDLVGFTKISASLPTTKLVEELSSIFTEFDHIMDRNGCIRIKTLGDGYMAACGVEKSKNDHAEKLAIAGLQMIQHLKNRSGKIKWQCRIGLNSGTAISGIIGKQRFQFDLIGDDVNIAARVESNGLPMSLTCTKSTALILPPEKFKVETIGHKQLKGKGEIELFKISLTKPKLH